MALKIDDPKNPVSPVDFAEELQWQSWEDNVIIHEGMHQAVGGSYVGAASYSYELKPNGKHYIVAGEVPVDMSFDEAEPDLMLQKFGIVMASALAPSDPSTQDLAVARHAQGLIGYAQSRLDEENQKPLSSLDGEPIFLS